MSQSQSQKLKNWPVPQNSIAHKKLVLKVAKAAEKILPLFENERPKDDRPRLAIDTAREWARTGVFKMKDIRGASLAAHAAARDAKSPAAKAAAHAAGQAVATAHVARHARGVEWYVKKAMMAVKNEQHSPPPRKQRWSYC